MRVKSLSQISAKPAIAASAPTPIRAITIGATPAGRTMATKPKSLLQQWLQPYRGSLSYAAIWAALSVPLLIAQCWFFAHIAANLLQQTEPAATNWGWFASCFMGRHLCLIAKDWQAQRTSRLVRSSLRQQCLEKLATLGPARQRFGPDGSLSTLVTEQIDALDGYISRYWPQLVQVVLAPLLIAIAVAYYSPFAAVLLLCTAPLVPVFMILVGLEASKASQRQLNVLSRMSGRLYDVLLGLPLLKRFNATEIAQAHLAGSATQYQKSTMKVLRLAFLSTAVLEFFTSLAIALVALYLGLGLLGELPWLKQQIPVDYMPALFILLLAPEFYQPLRQLGSDYHAKAQATAASLNLTPLWQATLPEITTTAQTIPQPTMIELQHIRVGRTEALRLQCPQLQLRMGQRYLVQGPSGSGKSTLLQVLAGFVAAEGEFLLDQQPFPWSQLPALRQHIAYFTQQAELQSGTVADNLRLAKPEASDAELQTVLQQVGLWDFLSQQLGLAYPLTEAGQGLSGGQQQRLAFARLVLQPKAIWLLDEPVAELDAQSAADIAQLIQQLSNGKLLLIASHQHDIFDWVDAHITCSQGRVSHEPTPTAQRHG